MEELLQVQEFFRTNVNAGLLVPLWGPGDIPQFIETKNWEENGIVLSAAELEDLFENEKRILQSKWN